MSISSYPIKDPTGIVDYAVDLSPLLASGETVISLGVDTVGMDLGNSYMSGNLAVAFVSGGEPGTIATLKFTPMTSQGRTLPQTLRVRIAPVYVD